jgi:hypothetical protein
MRSRIEQAKVLIEFAVYDCGGQASDDRFYLVRLATDFAHPPPG